MGHEDDSHRTDRGHESQRKTDVPDFRIGDRVEIHQKILDGAKERVQIFEGDVIARQNGGVRETVTVRRLVQGEGVERIFPIHSPRIAKIVVKKAGLGPPRQALLPPRSRRQGDQDRDDVKRQTQDRRRSEGGRREPPPRPPRKPPPRRPPRAGCRKSAQKKKAKKEAEAGRQEEVIVKTASGWGNRVLVHPRDYYLPRRGWIPKPRVAASAHPGKPSCGRCVMRFPGCARRLATLGSGMQPLRGKDKADCIRWS